MKIENIKKYDYADNNNNNDYLWCKIDIFAEFLGVKYMYLRNDNNEGIIITIGGIFNNI